MGFAEPVEHEWVERALAEAGCLEPRAEAEALLAASTAGAGTIDRLVARRSRGEPLAWITGWVSFCGLQIHVAPGVFVPRSHSEPLARRAAAQLPPGGIAVDLCTGSGAVAVVLATIAPRGTVVATELDPVAVACARRNGVHTLVGDLDEALPPSLRRRVDVMTAVVPYVPTGKMHLLPRDVLANEPHLALDGGPSGTTILDRAAAVAGRWLRPGGTALLEIGGDQAGHVASALSETGFVDIRVHRDDDGQDRSIEARRSGRSDAGSRFRSARERQGIASPRGTRHG